jgi:KaiC/GvpD/RAD55 family RecA-like ATPase
MERTKGASMNLQSINLAYIPASLQSRRQWVLWKLVTRGDKPTKIPCQADGANAKSDDPATWTDFQTAAAVAARFSGIGFVFAADDPYTGVDLDGCRDPETGRVAEWARQIVLDLKTYAEVSPSRTGIKLWLVGKSPMERGRKVTVKDAEPIGGKEPAIEVYDSLRYFAMTGWRVTGPTEPQSRQTELDALCAKFFPVEKRATGGEWYTEAATVERARKYLAKLPPAVSGQGGHNAAFHAACVLVLGFCLPGADALTLMREFSERCNPPWSERELQHKVSQAAKQPGPRGYLRNAKPERWQSVDVPDYREPTPAPKHEPRITTLADAAKDYLDSIRHGQTPLIETGISDLDYALGGGVERGELVIFAARPSHGKSAVALQCVHEWTRRGMPCAIISEEMSPTALGKRTMQFISDAPQEHWSDLTAHLDAQIDDYAKSHAPCIVLEGCGDSETAVAAVEAAIERHKIECVVVDYAQLLRGKGKTRYEQLTAVSVTLRQLASRHKLVLLALCQMSREIESRAEFRPAMSDLKETGQFEQDADVIVFLVWPWRIDQSNPQARFQFFVEKNRNRGINQRVVDCSFNPARQMITMPEIECPFQGRETPLPD